ncbi:MAG: glycosyltransferase family 2 protein [Spirochaetia bacterium]
MRKFSLVIPCYNEAENLPLMISRLKEIFASQRDFECILVNNGSTDNTNEVMDNILSKESIDWMKVIHVAKNEGYGYGILKGLEATEGELLGWTHADMQTDPHDVLKAFEIYQYSDNKEILVKGYRKNRKLMDSLFSFGMQCMVWAVLRVFVTEINAQPKVFSRNFYLKYIKDHAPYDFSLDLYLLYQGKKNRVPILSFPVYFTKRQYGEAKGGGGSWKNRIKLIKRTLSYIFMLRHQIKEGKHA